MKKSGLIKVALALILVLAGMSAVSCGNKYSLDNATWTLNSYGSPGSLTAVLPNSAITLEFDGADMTFSGNAGVNRCGGDYKVDQNKMTISNFIFTTITNTDQALYNQETAFFNILRAAQTFSITGNQLTITGTQGNLVFTGTHPTK